MVNGHFFDPLAFLGIFLSRCISYAFLMILLFIQEWCFWQFFVSVGILWHRVFGERASKSQDSKWVPFRGVNPAILFILD